MTCNQLPRRQDHLRYGRQRRREPWNGKTSPFFRESVVHRGGRQPDRVNRAGHGNGVDNDRSCRYLDDFA